MLLMCSLLFLFVPSVPRVPYVPSAFSIIPSVYMCRVCSRLCPVFPVWSPLFPVFPIESRVANVFPLVPCFSYFSPSVSRLFLVFWVGNLWEATSCRANTINTETVSIAYSVPSSQCVPNCVLCSLWVSFSLFSQCVPSVFPIVYSVPSFYCSQYVSSVSPLWSPLFVVYIPSVYVPCVFPMFPVRSLKSLFKRKTLFSVCYH